MFSTRRRLQEEINSLKSQIQTLTQLNSFLSEDKNKLSAQIEKLQEALVAKESPMSYSSIYPFEQFKEKEKYKEIQEQLKEVTAAHESDLFTSANEMFEMLTRAPVRNDGES